MMNTVTDMGETENVLVAALLEHFVISACAAAIQITKKFTAVAGTIKTPSDKGKDYLLQYCDQLVASST